MTSGWRHGPLANSRQRWVTLPWHVVRSVDFTPVVDKQGHNSQLALVAYADNPAVELPVDIGNVAWDPKLGAYVVRDLKRLTNQHADIHSAINRYHEPDRSRAASQPQRP
jgi:hypothetical protein